MSCSQQTVVCMPQDWKLSKPLNTEKYSMWTSAETEMGELYLNVLNGVLTRLKETDVVLADDTPDDYDEYIWSNGVKYLAYILAEENICIYEVENGAPGNGHDWIRNEYKKIQSLKHLL